MPASFSDVAAGSSERPMMPPSRTIATLARISLTAPPKICAFGPRPLIVAAIPAPATTFATSLSAVLLQRSRHQSDEWPWIRRSSAIGLLLPLVPLVEPIIRAAPRRPIEADECLRRARKVYGDELKLRLPQPLQLDLSLHKLAAQFGSLSIRLASQLTLSVQLVEVPALSRLRPGVDARGGC